MIVIGFVLAVGTAFCFGYYRGMRFIEQNWEGFMHYIDDVLNELNIKKSNK